MRQYFQHLPVHLLSAGLVAWALAIAAGMLTLADYSTSPGDALTGAMGWPADTSYPRALDRPNMLVFLHPHCPCSRATLSEIERLLPRLSSKPLVTFTFFSPDGQSDDWANSVLMKRARNINQALVVIDHDGQEARHFGAATSGHVIVFSPSGERVFSGGITSSRGHEGTNTATQAIAQLLSGVESDFTEYPVYGCPIIALEGSNDVL